MPETLESTPQELQAGAEKTVSRSVREDSIDTLKGIGITFVVLNHCFARGTRKFFDANVTTDPWLYGINRAIHFAVPLFLFISCALLARSLARNFDIKRYANSRFRKTVIPYIVASFLYALLYVGPPWGERWHWPKFFSDLAMGKASFHLYFTIVLIQASVVVPILVALTRKLKWKLPVVAIISFVAQLIIYELQRRAFNFRYPGSTLFWYMVPLLVGMGVGHYKDSAKHLRKYLPMFLVGSAISLVVYVYASIAPLIDRWTTSDLMNASYVVFSGFWTLALWTFVPSWKAVRVRRFFRTLGVVSLPLFLIHPAVMFFLGGPRGTAFIQSLPLSIVFYFLFTLGISYLLAVGIYKTKIGTLVLGQEMPKYEDKLLPAVA